MKSAKSLFPSLLVAGLALGFVSTARAQGEITLLAPGPTREPLNKVVMNFEAKTGNKVKITYGTGLSTRQSVAKGQALDVSLILPPFPGAEASGNVIPDSAVTVAYFQMAVATPKNAPKPDISSPSAVKKSFLAAKSIGYVDPDFGSAGEGATEAIDKLGIGDKIAGKSKVAPGGGPIQKGLADGTIDIGMLYLSDLLPNKDKVDIIGVLPRKICTPTALVGFVATKASDPAAAKALLQFLASPDSQAIFKEAGFEPHS